MNRLRSLMFPLMLALSLGILTAWLGRVSEVVLEEVKLDPNKPQYLMHGAKGRRFDEQGYLKENLTAESAWQLPDQKDVFFRNPLLKLYQQGAEQYSVGSRDARYHIETREVFFDNDVVLVKQADAERPDAEVHTDKLYVDTVSETARTDSFIRYRYGISEGSSQGMSYNNKTGYLDLPARVKATIYEQDRKTH